MKTLKALLSCLVAVLLFSCSNGKELQPAGTVFISGEVSEYVQVANAPATLTSEKNGDVVQFKLTVSLEMLKDGFKNVKPEEMDFGNMFSVAIISLLDEASGKVTDLHLNPDDFGKLRELLVTAKGTQSEVTFITDLPKDLGSDSYDKAASFKPSVAADVLIDATYCYVGSFGKYPIHMTIHVNRLGELTGAYYYDRYGPGHYLYLKGQKSSKRIAMNEFTDAGMHTGTFDATLNDGVFTGHFTTWSGGYDFTFQPDTEMAPIDFSGVDFSTFNEEFISNADFDFGGSGSNWDQVLDSYEQYVDKYISTLQRASNGDPTAIIEYADLFRKAQDLNEQLQKAEGTLTSAQWARYLRITNKMAQAAQNM